MDTKTLIIATLVVALTTSLGMALIFWTRRTYPGFGYWLAGSGFHTLAVLFILSRDLAPLWVAIILPGCFFLLELMLYVQGTRRFRDERPYPWRWGLFAALSFCVLMAYFLYAAPSLNARIALISLYAGGLDIWLVWLLARRRPAFFGAVEWVLAGLWGAFAVFNLSRLWYAVMVMPESLPLPGFDPGSVLHASFLIPLIVRMLLVTLGQIVMNAQRFEYDLRITQQALEEDIALRKHYERALKQARDDAEIANQRLVQANEELTKLATTDPLTSAWNRRHFEEVVEVALARARRYAEPLALLIFDIDHFKAINDRHGHHVGDQVLVEFVRLVQANLRVGDVLARWGGEEFILLLPHTIADAALSVGEKLRRLIADHPFPEVGQVTASFGVATLGRREGSESWISRADHALYAAKAGGRNLVCLADPTDPTRGPEDDTIR